ncbi:conserved hypothetical protein [Gammaproteobacteria bacterium]
MATALFLGRFQPPHVGHLLTIRHISSRYDRVIVGVTESAPSVMQIADVIGLLKQLLPEKNFEFVHVKGSVEEGTALIDLEFDVCCSGNPIVLERMKERGVRTEYVERSMDSIFSGTRERQTYLEGVMVRADLAKESSIVEFDLVETAKLRPIEKINPTHFKGIEVDIFENNVMNQPLIVDRVTLAVLDGSHRYAFLLKHGYELSPVLLCDYDDESIFVGNHLGHRFKYDRRKWISKQHVRATAISGNLYEPRTTRHFFPFRKKDRPTELGLLRRKSANSVDHLFSMVTKTQEILKNNDYIEELKFETSVLDEYMKEQVKVLAWLENQNRYINSLLS